MGLSGYVLTRQGGSEIYNIPIFLCLTVQVLSDSYGEEVSTGIGQHC